MWERTCAVCVRTNVHTATTRRKRNVFFGMVTPPLSLLTGWCGHRASCTRGRAYLRGSRPHPFTHLGLSMQTHSFRKNVMLTQLLVCGSRSVAKNVAAPRSVSTGDSIFPTPQQYPTNTHTHSSSYTNRSSRHARVAKIRFPLSFLGSRLPSRFIPFIPTSVAPPRWSSQSTAPQQRE